MYYCLYISGKLQPLPVPNDVLPWFVHAIKHMNGEMNYRRKMASIEKALPDNNISIHWHNRSTEGPRPYQ